MALLRNDYFTTTDPLTSAPQQRHHEQLRHASGAEG
jgi:hypothetical protein